jgi:hypothetical protein
MRTSWKWKPNLRMQQVQEVLVDCWSSEHNANKLEVKYKLPNAASISPVDCWPMNMMRTSWRSSPNAASTSPCWLLAQWTQCEQVGRGLIWISFLGQVSCLSSNLVSRQVNHISQAYVCWLLTCKLTEVVIVWRLNRTFELQLLNSSTISCLIVSNIYIAHPMQSKTA